MKVDWRNGVTFCLNEGLKETSVNTFNAGYHFLIVKVTLYPGKAAGISCQGFELYV
jgi:hypothetical protein